MNRINFYCNNFVFSCWLPKPAQSPAHHRQARLWTVHRIQHHLHAASLSRAALSHTWEERKSARSMLPRAARLALSQFLPWTVKEAARELTRQQAKLRYNPRWSGRTDRKHSTTYRRRRERVACFSPPTNLLYEGKLFPTTFTWAFLWKCSFSWLFLSCNRKRLAFLFTLKMSCWQSATKIVAYGKAEIISDFFCIPLWRKRCYCGNSTSHSISEDISRPLSFFLLDWRSRSLPSNLLTITYKEKQARIFNS